MSLDFFSLWLQRISHRQLHSDMLGKKFQTLSECFLLPCIALGVRIAQEGLRNHSRSLHTDPHVGSTVDHPWNSAHCAPPTVWCHPKIVHSQ